MSDRVRRQKRALRTRANIQRLKAIRLSVAKSACHTEAQLIDPEGKVLVYVSTKGKGLKALGAKHGGNVDAAMKVGAQVAKLALKQGLKEVAFDRSGYRYHGRLKALAEAAREGGLVF